MAGGRKGLAGDLGEKFGCDPDADSGHAHQDRVKRVGLHEFFDHCGDLVTLPMQARELFGQPRQHGRCRAGANHDDSLLVFERVPLRTLAASRPSGTRFFSCPKCPVISSFNAASRTLLVNCFNNPSGPVSDRPLSLAIRTNSLAAISSAECSGFFSIVEFTSFSVVAITAPFPPNSPSGASGRKP